MITKKVKRFYCEHPGCKKSGGAAWSMRYHEARCTANPNRACSMCELCGYDVWESLDALKAVLPDGHEWGRANSGSRDKGNERRMAIEGLNKLRKMTNCPACILAAIRQRGIASSCYRDDSLSGEDNDEGFDWKTERQAVLDAHVPGSP